MQNHFAVITLALKDYMLPCVSKRIFGMDCPGCGLQRSIVFLSEGKFTEAFYMYPAIYFLILLSGFLIFNRLYNTKYANQVIIFLSISTVAAILINYVIKLIQ